VSERELFRRVLRRMSRLWLAAANCLDRGEQATAAHYLRRRHDLQRAWERKDDTRVRQLLTRRWVS
jgi:hypothetical protein